MTNELPFERPGLLDALQDAEAIEIIRQLQDRKLPATVKTLARLTSMRAAVVQSKLDLLSAVGIVTALRASRAYRDWRYRLISPEIHIRVNTRDPATWRRMDSYQSAERQRVLRQIEERRALAPLVPPMFRYFVMHMAEMTAAEQRELRTRIRAVESYVASLEKRSHRMGSQVRAATSERTNLHAVTVEVSPLTSPLPLKPTVHFLALETPSDRQVPKGTDRASLSPRESEIARLLADGLSRPQIAKSLKISPHTVCALSTRVYRKLGVRTRAHLARVMLGTQGA